MDAKKIEKLEKLLKFTGFGDIPQNKLIEKLNSDEKTFSIPLIKKFGEDEINAVANFRRGKQEVFFNSYDALVKTQQGEEIRLKIKIDGPSPVMDKQQPEKKEWISSNITMKEALNIALGRAVNNDFVKLDKEGNDALNQKYNAWQVADFKNPNEDGTFPIVKLYNFDIEKTLAQYPIKELANEKYKAELLESLKRGNLQSVTFDKPDGTSEKFAIEANPSFRTINIYDGNKNEISLNMRIQTQVTNDNPEQHQDSAKTQSEKKSQEQTAEEAASDEGPKQRGRKRGKGISAA